MSDWSYHYCLFLNSVNVNIQSKTLPNLELNDKHMSENQTNMETSGQPNPIVC